MIGDLRKASRALRKGDFVSVNAVEGVVAEVGTLATKVVTMRNEEITIPNSVLIGNPIKVIPAGHVGVKDFFGNVSPNVVMPGVRFVFPFTRVVKMSVKTQEVKETAEVPSKEGLTMDLEGSLLFRLDPARAADIYKTIGPEYEEIAVRPQIRSAIREVTASYEAKVLYSAERDKIAGVFGRAREEIAWGHTAPVQHLYGHGPQFGRTP